MKKFDLKEEGNVYRKILNIFLIALITLILIGIIWSTFFYQRSCENRACFNYYLENCISANYLDNVSIKFYGINGLTPEGCEVKVVDSSKPDEHFVCYLKLGKTYIPDALLDKCEVKRGS